MRNQITKLLKASLSLTTNYQTIDFPSDLGAVIAHGGQVILTFKRTGGTSVTFKIDEYMGADAGWVAKTEDDGASLTVIERTSTVSEFSYAFTTLAEKIRVQVKGAGGESLDAYITVGEVA